MIRLEMYVEGVQALGHGALRPKRCECEARAVAVEEPDGQGCVDVRCLRCGKPFDG